MKTRIPRARNFARSTDPCLRGRGRCKIDDQARVIANGDTILGSVPGIYSIHLCNVKRIEFLLSLFLFFFFFQKRMIIIFGYYIDEIRVFIYLERKLFKVYDYLKFNFISRMIDRRKEKDIIFNK